MNNIVNVYQCQVCGGLLKKGMAIKHTEQGNYHVHCFLKLKMTVGNSPTATPPKTVVSQR